MNHIIELTQDQKDLIYMGSHIRFHEEGESYYYLPYWFKENIDGNFEMFTFEHLPEGLVNKLKELRD